MEVDHLDADSGSEESGEESGLFEAVCLGVIHVGRLLIFGLGVCRRSRI